MNRQDLIDYVESHPHTQFRLILKQSLGKIRMENIKSEMLTNPYSGKSIPHFTTEEVVYNLNDIVVAIPRERFGPISFTAVLQSPTYRESDRNWKYIGYDNVQSIEAMP